MVPWSHSVLSADECTLQHFKEGLGSTLSYEAYTCAQETKPQIFAEFWSRDKIIFQLSCVLFPFFLCNEAQVTTGLHIPYQK